MITDVQYMQLVNEYYDLSDYKTKKEILFCNEAKKMANVEHIVGKLYEHIKANYVGIDFGTIPKSRGVITKVENFQQMVDCLNIIRDLIVEYNEDPKQVTVLYNVIDNIQKRERTFAKAFALNIELPIMLYNMGVMSVVAGTSLLITSSIEYIKNGHDSFSMSFDKVSYNKSQNHVLFQYAEQFNSECRNGNIDKLCNECIKNNLSSVKESVNNRDLDSLNETPFAILAGFPLLIKVILGAGLVFGSIMTIFGFLRRAIYWVLRMRMTVADYFAIQAEFLRINAENLKYRDDDRGDDHKKVVYQRQMKIVETLKKLSNFFALKDIKSQRDSEKDDDEYKKKRRKEDDDSSDNDGGLF